ncbi:MAG: dihydrofolate reductase [Prevotella sp.]|jgi:dihydrofolate reductase
MRITLIAALDRQRAIGYQNRLLFHLPEDLEHFKRLTMGHTVIMGRRTFESLPKGPLTKRRNIVLSRSLSHIDGCEVFTSLDAALQSCADKEEVFVIGGASVYAEALPLADRLQLTLVDQMASKADAFFPPYDEWLLLDSEKHNGFSFLVFERK